MSALPILQLRAVGKSYGANRVLKGIDLDIMRGEIVTLIGPSGSGKTTALRCMNFLEAYDEGEVWIKGQLLGYRSSGRTPRDRDSEASIAEVRRPVAMVFQQFNLWPHMSVLDNVAAPLVLAKKMPKRDAREKARKALERVGMGHKADAWPASLSGGQQQRVGIARALAIEPEVMLLDEPTSALDPELVEEVLNVIRSLAQDGMTMVMVTHEMSFAAKISDKVVFMEAGAIVEAGPPAQLFGNTRTPRLQQFLKPWLERSLTFAAEPALAAQGAAS
ncbi:MULTISPECIES: amino acid ABC transporter ATP-binding protein [Paraburkholderia]|uniref:Amino acid ABC transporter ATP-binding protein (PAAT family) n=1 Tax=Paraburkholderia tropica TaxID=92647 RepID=A0A1A5XF61_9BURK|nr:amino acid ABC transporter ATP-binding protein [Paraburkholderia tropica]MBB2982559.1 polar amino acid transport system ATP-binding protein [Paraburkholderia tropica]MBB3001713.1 polar amino acid transport system ATP-binding protein [Paraburkholderia tropica]MBB6321091.1 polar amino acid transport system ATP-binding protein [Paraburkholderia tropica]MDE1144818.1 amino acid ABC transporter ATP-binding protein [Paraburkholderia tropica]OBR52052.1 ATP-binding protein [Paraburkholderia tropica]